MATQLSETSPGLLRIIELDAAAYARAEVFVTAHPEALIYHHPAWLQVLEEEYGQQGIYLGCEDGQGRLRGVLPLLHTRGLPLPGQSTARRLSSLPRTPVAGPLALDGEATVALVHAAVERVRKDMKVRLQLKTPSASLDGIVEGMVCIPWWLRYVLALPERPDELRFGDSRNHARIRSAVNKATKQGIQVRAAETESELYRWYELYLEAMRWHAIPPRPYRCFQAMWQIMRPRGLMRLLLAEQNGRSNPLAGSIFLTCGQIFFYAFNGRSKEALSARANDVIQWQAIHQACREGFRQYDLGEVAADNHSLAYFKGKWGSEPRQLFRYYYPTPRKLHIHPLEGDGRWHEIFRTMWRHLPLAATAFVGDRVYRYL